MLWILYCKRGACKERDKVALSLTYRSPSNGDYRVEIVIYKHCSLIETSKFHGRNLLWQASGATFDGAMAQARTIGMEADELEDFSLTP
jgi:hypothetical protein